MVNNPRAVFHKWIWSMKLYPANKSLLHCKKSWNFAHYRKVRIQRFFYLFSSLKNGYWQFPANIQNRNQYKISLVIHFLFEIYSIQWIFLPGNTYRAFIIFLKIGETTQKQKRCLAVHNWQHYNFVSALVVHGNKLTSAAL